MGATEAAPPSPSAVADPTPSPTPGPNPAPSPGPSPGPTPVPLPSVGPTPAPVPSLTPAPALASDGGQVAASESIRCAPFLLRHAGQLCAWLLVLRGAAMPCKA